MRATTTCGGLSAYTLADTFRTAQAIFTTVTIGATFTPANVIIKRGDYMRWEGNLSLHPIISGPAGNPDGRFASPLAGSVYEHRFILAGSYPYYCNVHGVLGFITVE